MIQLCSSFLEASKWWWNWNCPSLWQLLCARILCYHCSCFYFGSGIIWLYGGDLQEPGSGGQQNGGCGLDAGGIKPLGHHEPPLYFFRTLDFQQFIFDKVESWKTTLHAFFVSKAFISNTGIKLGIKRSWNKHYKLKTSWVKSIIATASIHY